MSVAMSVSISAVSLKTVWK